MISIDVRDDELVRKFSAIEMRDGVAVTVSIGLPMLMRKDRAALVARARELANAILDRIIRDPQAP